MILFPPTTVHNEYSTIIIIERILLLLDYQVVLWKTTPIIILVRGTAQFKLGEMMMTKLYSQASYQYYSRDHL